MNRLILTLLLGVLVCAVARVETVAAEPALRDMRPLHVAWLGADALRRGTDAGVVLSPLRPIHYRCRWDCRTCRHDCYGTWRIRFYGGHCRRQFTLCMRDCWDRICRWC